MGRNYAKYAFLVSPGLLAPASEGFAIGRFSYSSVDAVGFRAAQVAAIEGAGFDATLAGALFSAGIGLAALGGLEFAYESTNGFRGWAVTAVPVNLAAKGWIDLGACPPSSLGSVGYHSAAFGFCLTGQGLSQPGPLTLAIENNKYVGFWAYKPTGTPGIFTSDTQHLWQNPNYPAAGPDARALVTNQVVLGEPEAAVESSVAYATPEPYAYAWEDPAASEGLRPYELPAVTFDYTPGARGPERGSREEPHQLRKPKKWEREKKRLLSGLLLGLRVSMTAHQVLSCMVANTKSWRHYTLGSGASVHSFKNGSARGKSLQQMYQYVYDNIDNLDMAGFAACVATRQAASIATGAMGRRLTPDLQRSTNGGWWVPKVHVQPPLGSPVEVDREGRKKHSYRMR